MKLVSWNVNSLKARLPRVLEHLELHAPDVVCLQETKCDAAGFPEAELREAGYGAVHHSGGRWAGVAILVRDGLEVSDPVSGLPGEVREDQARWVEATVDGLRVASVYVVNGQAVGSEPWAEKLAFLEAMAVRVEQLRAAGAPIAVLGDFNVAPHDVDVYDPAAFEGSTHVTEEERGMVDAFLARGDLVDAYRVVHPLPEVGYTWWDYRQGHFHRKLGLRIDLVCVSSSLAGRLTEVAIDRNFRKGTKPSDHAPLMAELAPA